MSVEIKVPVFPESITEGTIATWHKKEGEFAKRDENIVDVETDKVVLEVVAPHDGIVEKIIKQQGATVKSDEVIGLFKEGSEGKASTEKQPTQSQESTKEEKNKTADTTSKTQSAPIKESSSNKEQIPNAQSPASEKERTMSAVTSPSVRRMLGEQVSGENVRGSGKDGSITKQDILKGASEKVVQEKAKDTQEKNKAKSSAAELITQDFVLGQRIEKRVPMTRLRARIAERLLDAQHNAAILTTFNEVNMQPIITLRQKYKETFEKTYGVRLGFMSFFTLSVVEALKQFPIINASVDGQDIVYHGYYDIGIAVSTERGLVVPILRNAETMSMADIEAKIIELAKKAEKGSISIEDITGGTFTITNGGVFGSLMATPIINPPQSAILGMHKIQERAVVENGQIVIRPMMYIALSYDHRIIDGADSVRFLVTVKELLEDPARLALGI